MPGGQGTGYRADGSAITGMYSANVGAGGRLGTSCRRSLADSPAVPAVAGGAELRLAGCGGLPGRHAGTAQDLWVDSA